ncbi:hypothetical protein HOG21_00425 [bacterium]|jgi:S-adenosylmethionine/arginine decarboxylase-like enzyme|nr:hypothetical protein [bacterium]
MKKNIPISSNRERQETCLENNCNSSLYLARHLTLDYYDCDSKILHDQDLLEKTLIESAKAI